MLLKRITGQELCLIFLLIFLGCSKDDDLLPQATAVEEVEIVTEERNVTIGEIIQLNSAVIPEDADNPTILWGTDNPDVATVDELGKVTGHKLGVVTIFAISKENLRISDSVILQVE